jgi:hypothetical protein
MGLGRAPASMVNRISFSAPDDSSDGEGDNMTLGMRWCLLLSGLECASGSSVPDPNDLELRVVDKESGDNVGMDTGGGVIVVVAVMFQLYPGLTIKLTVSPSLILLYSLSSLPSASAFPLNKSRWASAEGAEGSDASCAFIAEIVSVSRTLIVKVAGGFRDLNTRGMEAKRSNVTIRMCTKTRRKLQQVVGNETDLMKIQMAGVEIRVRGVVVLQSSDW